MGEGDHAAHLNQVHKPVQGSYKVPYQNHIVTRTHILHNWKQLKLKLEAVFGRIDKSEVVKIVY